MRIRYAARGEKSLLRLRPPFPGVDSNVPVSTLRLGYNDAALKGAYNCCLEDSNSRGAAHWLSEGFLRWRLWLPDHRRRYRLPAWRHRRS